MNKIISFPNSFILEVLFLCSFVCQRTQNSMTLLGEQALESQQALNLDFVTKQLCDLGQVLELL